MKCSCAGAAVLLSFLFVSVNTNAQIEIKGTVFDNSRQNYVEGVRVVNTCGIFAITDSLGKYSILTRENDSLYFVYNNKATMRFAVKEIADPMAFDISIKAKVESKYKVLKEVIVYSKSYKEDSLENRETYARIFNFNKPGLESSVGPDGAVGFDINELINMFRFRRNRMMKTFQERLLREEQEKYVDMRFGKGIVSRITGLTGVDLDSFMAGYRPTFEFTQQCGELEFNQYILNASYHYRMLQQLPARRKE